MDIEQRIDLHFGEKVSGIVLDNAYDLWRKNKYIEYVKNNHVIYIFSRDTDMRNLSDFSHIEYLTVPEEAEHLESLICLTNLKGLEISARCLSHINLSWFPKLDDLVVHGQPDEASDFTSIRRLYCSQWEMKDLRGFWGIQRIKSLTLDFCSKLETLRGVEEFSDLEEVCLDYCSQLSDIDCLQNLSDSLKKLTITDCNRVKDFRIFERLKKLEILHLTRFQTSGTGKLASVKFMDSLPALQSFMTSYRVEDNDLKPLLRLKEVTLLKYFRGYNVSESELP